MTIRFLPGLPVLLGCALACSAGSPSKNSNVNPGPTGGGVAGSGGSFSGVAGSTGTAGTGGILLGTAGMPDAGDNPCKTTLDVTYRDFTEMHPDFERGFAGDVPRRHLIESTLDSNRKPIFKDSIGCPWLMTSPTECDNWQASNAVIESAATFAQWYNTIDGVNQEIHKPLELAPTGTGQFAFSSTMFFPLGPTEGFGLSPKNNDQMQNFLFTTEVHVLFGYIAGQTFEFSGDDDLWIFVNGKLALDLGSMHSEADGKIEFDAQAVALGISPGNTYQMDIFHAERHTRASDFKITTNIACFTPAPPPK